VERFAAHHGPGIGSFYSENESGAKLARPALFRLLSDAKPGDTLLIEQVDRLSRLTASSWERLGAELAARHIRDIALDLLTIAAEGSNDRVRMQAARILLYRAYGQSSPGRAGH
jgi:DNA invertase Pin-like site-specific DNA recombinase